MRSFTIVRLPQAPSRGSSPIGRPRLAPAGGVAGPAAVESAELGPRDIGDVARDPSIAAYAPKMPMRLIQPLARREPGEQDEPWGIAAVGADASTFDGAGVLVAVLDSGIDSTHPAFAGMTLDEHDFTDSGNGDQHGHGTHCAGTIFGRDVGGVRIGIARGIQRALIGKVLGPDGGGDTDATYRAINWALDGGAQVISMSLGVDFPGYVQQLVMEEDLRVDVATSQALEAYRLNLRTIDALMRLVEIRSDQANGAIVVAAAGNESGRDEDPPFDIAVSVPAAATGILSVGAVGRGEDGFVVAPFSNAYPVLSAPGVDIISARAGGGLTTMSGTSMATPHVAGVAALWWQAIASSRGRLTASGVEARLRGSAISDRFSITAVPANYGDGLVRAP